MSDTTIEATTGDGTAAPAVTTPDASQFTGVSTPGAGIDQTPEPVATPQTTVTDSAGDKTFPQEYVRELRAEAAKNRVELQKAIADAEAKAQQAAAEAAARSREELAQSLGKALGIVKDDAPVDPAELLKQAQAKATEAERMSATNRSQAQSLQVELALYRAADRAGADSAALLDSRSFMDEVKGLDPTASDFASQVEAAIAQKLESNPRYRKAAQRVVTASRSGGDMTAGNADPAPGNAEPTIEERRKLRRDRRASGVRAGGVTHGESTPMPAGWVF